MSGVVSDVMKGTRECAPMRNRAPVTSMSFVFDILPLARIYQPVCGDVMNDGIEVYAELLFRFKSWS